MDLVNNNIYKINKYNNFSGSLDKQLIALLQDGLPLTDRPYGEIADQLGVSEATVIDRISILIKQGLIKRFGIIVKHHELGYKANAMVVWDIPDSQVHDIARQMKQYSFITLCYRRPRQLPQWPYNLFCMIHGMDRDNVMILLNTMILANSWEHYPHEILFSKRRFKQKGACISGKKQNNSCKNTGFIQSQQAIT